jgi:hypothetical protein
VQQGNDGNAHQCCHQHHVQGKPWLHKRIKHGEGEQDTGETVAANPPPGGKTVDLQESQNGSGGDQPPEINGRKPHNEVEEGKKDDCG